MMLLDAIIIFMLLVTIAYCWQLNRKIVQLQKGKSEFAKLFITFDKSLMRAEQEMRSLKEQTQAMSAALGRKTEIAKELIDDLSDLENKGRMIYQSLEIATAEAKEQQLALEASASSHQVISNRFRQIESAMPSAANQENITRVSTPVAKVGAESRDNLAREIQQVFAAKSALATTASEEVSYAEDKRVPYRPSRETDQHKQAIESLLKKISEVNRK